jgi:hypothetical protein
MLVSIATCRLEFPPLLSQKLCQHKTFIWQSFIANRCLLYSAIVHLSFIKQKAYLSEPLGHTVKYSYYKYLLKNCRNF